MGKNKINETKQKENGIKIIKLTEIGIKKENDQMDKTEKGQISQMSIQTGQDDRIDVDNGDIVIGGKPLKEEKSDDEMDMDQIDQNESTTNNYKLIIKSEAESSKPNDHGIEKEVPIFNFEVDDEDDDDEEDRDPLAIDEDDEEYNEEDEEEDLDTDFDSNVSDNESSEEEEKKTKAKKVKVKKETKTQRKRKRNYSYTTNFPEGVDTKMCKICNEKFGNYKYRYFEHNYIKHDGPKYFNCGACDETFGTYQKFTNHQKSVHDPKVSCPECNKIMGQGILQRHLQHLHPDTRFQCQICDYSTKRRNLLKNHEEMHSNGSAVCHICGKKLKSNFCLTSHMKLFHGERKYKCDQCDSSFGQPGILKKHYRIHLSKSERPFKCNICPETFICKSHLVNHINKHNGTLKFKCDECDKTFALASSLNRHKLAHLPESEKLTLKCPHCPKKFARKHNLKEHHKRMHLNTVIMNKFQCSFPGCEKIYKDARRLGTHEEIHKSTEKFPCENCGKEFPTEFFLKRHIYFVHSSKGYRAKKEGKAKKD